MFYDYRYGDNESAVFFIYDNSLPPTDPEHLLVVGVRPQSDKTMLYMVTDGDNDSLH
jgi:hypothetical protein